MDDEHRLSDKEILEREEYKSASVKKSFKNTGFYKEMAGIFSVVWNSGVVWAVRNSPPGRLIGSIAKGINAALSHPAGKLVTFGLSIALGALAVVGTGGAALALPAAALALTVGAKVVKAGFDAQHENKMRSLKHQLNMLRILKHQTLVHEHRIGRTRDSASERTRGELTDVRRSISAVDEHKSATGLSVHHRNMPTLSNEIAKTIGSNILAAAGFATDVSAGVTASASAAHHAAEKGGESLGKTGELTSHTLDANEVTVGAAEDFEEGLDSADKEAVLKARINMLSKELGVPKSRNTAELTKYVRGKMSSLRAEQRVVEEHFRDGFASEQAMQDRFIKYKKESDQNKIFDAEMREHTERAGYTKRMMVRMAEALVGSREEWVGKSSASVQTPEAPARTASARSRSGSVER